MKFTTTFAWILFVAGPAFAAPPDGPERGNRPNRPLHGAPRGLPSGSAFPPPVAPSAEGRPPAPRGGEHSGPRSHWITPEIRQKLGEKKFDREQFKKHIAEWKQSRDTRREEQRRALLSRWGAALAKPSVADELRLHARRLARLQRFEELVATEKQGDERVRSLDRIQKMRDHEERRHQRAMLRLSNEPGVNAPATSPAGSGAAPTLSGSPSSAPAPSGGVQ